MRKRASRPQEQIFAVTGLPASLKDDQDERIHRYLVSMGIRTACFILAVIAIAVLHWTVLGWVLIAAAVVLPYIAVVMANATRSPGSTTIGPVATEQATDKTTDVTPDLTTDDASDNTDPTHAAENTRDDGAATQPSPRGPDEEPFR